MTTEIDIRHRLDRAHELRAAIRQPAALVDLAQQLLAATPGDCDVLVAFSPEGQAVGAAAAALAYERGRPLPLERASHIAPLAPGPQRSAWRWMSVEEALGLGGVRPWVVSWARERGGGPPAKPLERQHLAKVA